MALDDSEHLALHQFFPAGRGEGTYNSDFVLINGSEASSSHDLWEILHIESRQLSIAAIRSQIDAVQAPSIPVVAPLLSQPEWVDGSFSFLVEGEIGQSAVIQLSRNGVVWEDVQSVTFEESPSLVIEALREGSAPVFFRALIP